jgi:hypothetical protein
MAPVHGSKCRSHLRAQGWRPQDFHIFAEAQ